MKFVDLDAMVENNIIHIIYLKREEEGSIRTEEIRKERNNLFIKRSNIYTTLMKLIKKLPKSYRYRAIDKIEEYAEIIDEENSAYMEKYYEARI